MITFVCSTNFSGSTLLDVMLGHGDDCLACGEVYALFRRDTVPDCTCGNPDCRIWERAKRNGWKRLYKTLYDEGVRHISDSSKSWNWYMAQEKYVEKRGYELKTVFIYKHPLNLLYSFFKRRQPITHKYWLRYYGKYMPHFPDAVVVSYEDLVSQPKTMLRKICDELGYRYFDGKERFWEGASHHLYGSLTVRVHFHNKNSNRFEAINKNLRKKRRSRLHSIEKHRTIYSIQDWQEKLPEEYRAMPDNVVRLYEQLENRKIS